MNREEKGNRYSCGPAAFSQVRNPGPCRSICYRRAGHYIYHVGYFDLYNREWFTACFSAIDNMFEEVSL